MVKLYAPSTNAVTQPWGAEFTEYAGQTFPRGFYRQNYGWYGHNGIDYAHGPDRNVYAAGDGVVVWADWAPRNSLYSGGGIVTEIDHGTFSTVYAHLNDNNMVKVGQRVKAGQIVGKIGGTGGVIGDHLHFEVIPKNPNTGNGWYGRSKPVLVSDKPATVKTASGTTIKPIGDIMATLDKDDLEAIAKAVWTYDQGGKTKQAWHFQKNLASIVWGRTYASPTNGKKYSVATYLINANVNAWKIPGLQRIVEKIAGKNGIGQAELDAAVKEINDNTEAVVAGGVDVEITVNGKDFK